MLFIGKTVHFQEEISKQSVGSKIPIWRKKIWIENIFFVDVSGFVLGKISILMPELICILAPRLIKLLTVELIIITKIVIKLPMFSRFSEEQHHPIKGKLFEDETRAILRRMGLTTHESLIDILTRSSDCIPSQAPQGPEASVDQQPPCQRLHQ